MGRSLLYSLGINTSWSLGLMCPFEVHLFLLWPQWWSANSIFFNCLIFTIHCVLFTVTFLLFTVITLISWQFFPHHGAVQGSRQGLFQPRRFLLLHQSLGNDLTWPLSLTNPSWSGESAAVPAVDTSWPRIALRSSERSWRPLMLDGAGWNVLYETLQAWASISVPKLCNFHLQCLVNFVKN